MTHGPNHDAFLDEIEAVCKKHGLSISHQDFQGAFIIEPFDPRNMEWLRQADHKPGA